MNIDLSGTTALVTGSTGGIGHAIAKGFAGAGADVIVNGRGQAKVDQAIASIGKVAPSAKVRGVAADVSTAEGCAALVKAVPQVDILINNTGIFEPKPFFDIPDEDWHRFFDVNVMSGIRLSRAYMPGMLKKNCGRSVFIASESAIMIPKEMIHYGMTKTAQLSISRGLAELTKGTAVPVNSVLPGPTMSEGVETFVTDLAKQNGQSVETAAANFIKEHRPSSLIQRFASVEEIANMVVYVASREASATNGAALGAEGVLEFDRGCLEVRIGLHDQVERCFHVFFRHGAVDRIALARVRECLDVKCLVAQPVFMRNDFGDLLRRGLGEPGQRLLEDIDEGLHGLRILVDEVLLHVENCRRIGGAKDVHGAPGGPGFNDNLDVTGLLEFGNHRIELRNGINLLVLNRGNCRGAAADADKGGVMRVQAVLDHQVLNEAMGR